MCSARFHAPLDRKLVGVYGYARVVVCVKTRNRKDIMCVPTNKLPPASPRERASPAQQAAKNKTVDMLACLKREPARLRCDWRFVCGKSGGGCSNAETCVQMCRCHVWALLCGFAGIGDFVEVRARKTNYFVMCAIDIIARLHTKLVPEYITPM